VTYEGLHLDGPGNLAAVLAFLGADASAEDVIADALEYAAFERMQGRERDGGFSEANRRLVPKDPDDPESFKVRKGVVGGYRDYLSAGDIGFLEERIAALQPEELGYLEPGVPPARRTFGAEAAESGA
jgi:hypothetical protein